MTRTVNCLADAGLRRAAARTRPTAGRCWSYGSRRRGARMVHAERPAAAGTPGSPQLARPTSTCATSSPPILQRIAASDHDRRRSHQSSPRFRSLAQPQLPPLLRRQRRLQRRHLDAAHRPGLAGPEPSPAAAGAALGITTGLQFLPVLLLIALRRGHRRPLPQAPPAAGRPRRSMAARRRCALGALAALGVAEVWHVYVLAFLFGIGAAFDAPAPPGVRLRDGRPRRRSRTPSASTRPRSTPPASIGPRHWPGLLIGIGWRRDARRPAG